MVEWALALGLVMARLDTAHLQAARPVCTRSYYFARMYRPSGEPWLLMCMDGRAWSAYPRAHTQRKLFKSMAWSVGTLPKGYSVIESRPTFKRHG